ncbi:MAG: hypothetical protein RL456_2611 [Pseudomonadota bacterium]|jgi:flagellar hook-associated protein 2
MPSVTSTGLGSGLDVSSIVTSLMEVERRPLNQIRQEEASLNARISSFGRLQGLLATLRDKAAALAGADLWNPSAMTLSDPSVATVTAADGAAPVAGSHRLEVQALATPQTLASAPMASSASMLSEGTLTIETGRWIGTVPATGFTPSGSVPVSVTIGPGQTSLASIRDRINASSTDVAASIVSDAGGARLVLRSTSTGEAHAFRIAVHEASDDGDPATGLSALAFDATRTDSPMTRHQAAADARATVDGLPVVSATNTLTGVLDGMSLTLQRTTTSEVGLTVRRDDAAVRTAVTDFAAAWNALATQLRTDTAYDAGTRSAATLQGDRAAVMLQSRLRTLLGEAYGGGDADGLTRLADLGLTVGREGTLQVSGAALDRALARPDAMRRMLGRADADDATAGLMVRLRRYADAALGTDGLIEARTDSLRARQRLLGDREGAMQRRLDATEQRLRRQYEVLDRDMARLGGLGSSVAQWIGSLGDPG